jgi:phage antirepressor YoqD-like protein
MDKRKVIAAYRSGLISVQECAQILGVDNVQLIGLIRETGEAKRRIATKQSVRS